MTLRWGIVGAGNIAGVFAKGLKTSKTGTAYAIGSRAQDKADAFAKEHGMEKAYGSYDALLADGDVDAVYVATPHTLHHENVLACAQAKKHILCEKPMGVTVAECEQMIVAAKTNGVVLFEAFMYRVHPQTLKIQQILKEGALGEVRSIHSTFCFGLGDAYNVRLDKSLRGGGLYDVGCYCINFSRMVARGDPDAIHAVVMKGPKTDVDENLVGALHFPSGALASFNCSVRSMGDASAYVIGTEGILRVPSPWKPGANATMTLVRAGAGAEEVVTECGEGLYAMEADHVAAVLAGEAESMITPEDATENARVLDAIWKSVHGS